MKSIKLGMLTAFPLILAAYFSFSESVVGIGAARSAHRELAAASEFVATTKVTASDGANDDFFGGAVAVSGDIAAIGSYNDDLTAGDGAGSVYIYARSGGVWTQQQKLTASDAGQDDNFGVSVAISGDTLVIGADRDDTAAGSAYVFVRSGNVWTQQQKLTATDGSGFDLYGHSVAISGDTAVIGAFNSNTPGVNDSGSVYVYTRAGTVWTLQQKLAASDAGIQDNFGFSVAINGDTIVAGAYQDDLTAGSDAGSAYVFTRTGNVWTQQQKLTASDAAESDLFGNAVAISGNTVVIGAFFDDTPRGDSAGSAYVFTRTGTVWTQQQHLTASDGSAIDDFGFSVAIGGNTIVVGAVGGDTASGFNTGSAYIFTRTGTVWTQQQELAASDGANEDFFGTSVTIGGNTVLVGSSFDDTPGGNNAGSAFFYATPGVSIAGRVLTPTGQALRNATVVLTDSQGVRLSSTTSSFGLYSFDNVRAGDQYIVSVSSKRFRFSSQILQPTGNIANLDLVGLE